MSQMSCWECGELTVGGICRREHPGYDHARARRRGYVSGGYPVLSVAREPRAESQDEWDWTEPPPEEPPPPPPPDLQEALARARALVEALERLAAGEGFAVPFEAARAGAP